MAPEDRLHSSLPPHVTTIWTLQWLQRQWEKAVEEPRRRRQYWRNCREEMECAHQDCG